MKNPHAVALGRLGGKAGRGDSKRRNVKLSPEGIAKMQAGRAAQRAAIRQQQEKE
jgi:hypothetical protein